MSYLAADALRGRGSATADEATAARWAATQFASFGLEPGGKQGFLQRVPIPQQLPPSSMAKRNQGLPSATRMQTWNVIGILRGKNDSPTDKTTDEAILLTAHIDHLGIGSAVDGDNIYNGADDDASGITAVVELARALAQGPRPKRTILFVLFGSEEIGGFGNRYFLAHPPIPLHQIVASLEFEMIGRPDPTILSGYLWLTGYERSTLGPELVKHGARLVSDPRPRQHFFQRSDNYDLAKYGIIAQTISSFGLHKDYHQPSDENAKIDFPFLTSAIQSMLAPIRWLANTEWKPEWIAGGQP
jgi:Zn-dependent M28 family amino/carboxypeptidase